MALGEQEKIEYLRGYSGRPIKIMEVCGTHTAAIMKSGIRSLLPESIRLVSGPGCPVCVTPASYIDRCIEIAKTPGQCLVSFGDMLKVPGTAKNTSTLSDALASGGSVHMVYSPFEVIELAAGNPDIEYVIAAVGFETTAPAYALLLAEARERGLPNIKFLTALKSALAAISHICESGEDVDAFICPGHVSVITGAAAYAPLAARYKKPFVIAGFEAQHILAGVYDCVRHVGASPAEAHPANLYPEAVSEHGNEKALALINKYYERKDALWRGLGNIPASAFVLKKEYADRSVPYEDAEDALPEGCRCGEVILGRIDPPDCPLFGKGCAPGRAIGPCMVSSEGACGIWFKNSAILHL